MEESVVFGGTSIVTEKFYQIGLASMQLLSEFQQLHQGLTACIAGMSYLSEFAGTQGAQTVDVSIASPDEKAVGAWGALSVKAQDGANHLQQVTKALQEMTAAAKNTGGLTLQNRVQSQVETMKISMSSDVTSAMKTFSAFGNMQGGMLNYGNGFSTMAANVRTAAQGMEVMRKNSMNLTMEITRLNQDSTQTSSSMRQVESAINNTGNAAGGSAKKISEYINSFSGLYDKAKEMVDLEKLYDMSDSYTSMQNLSLQFDNSGGGDITGEILDLSKETHLDADKTATLVNDARVLLNTDDSGLAMAFAGFIAQSAAVQNQDAASALSAVKTVLNDNKMVEDEMTSLKQYLTSDTMAGLQSAVSAAGEQGLDMGGALQVFSQSAALVNEDFNSLNVTLSQLKEMAQTELMIAFAPLLELLSMGANFIAENWDSLVPILFGVGAALGFLAAAYGIYTVATHIAAFASKLLNGTLLQNPFLWIALVIGVVVAAVYRFVQAVGGLQNAWEISKLALVAGWNYLTLQFLKLHNYLATFTENLSLKFMEFKMNVLNALGDMRVKALQILQNLVNGAIDNINQFIGLMNAIPGIEIQTIQHVDFGSVAALENDAKQAAREEELERARLQAEENASLRQAAIALQETELNDSVAALTTTFRDYTAQAEENEASYDLSAFDFEPLSGDGNDTTQGAGTSYTDDANSYLRGISDNTEQLVDADLQNSEDFSFLRQVAEREALEKITNTQIQFTLNSSPTVNGQVDLDGYVDKLSREMSTTLVSKASALL